MLTNAHEVDDRHDYQEDHPNRNRDARIRIDKHKGQDQQQCRSDVMGLFSFFSRLATGNRTCSRSSGIAVPVFIVPRSRSLRCSCRPWRSGLRRSTGRPYRYLCIRPDRIRHTGRYLLRHLRPDRFRYGSRHLRLDRRHRRGDRARRSFRNKNRYVQPRPGIPRSRRSLAPVQHAAPGTPDSIPDDPGRIKFDATMPANHGSNPSSFIYTNGSLFILS